MEEPPPLRLLTRTHNATTLYQGPPATGKLEDLQSGATGTIEFSDDGKWLCAGSRQKVDIISTQSMETVHSMHIDSAVSVSFSPQGTYLVTYQRPKKELGGGHKNLQVWSVSSGELVWELHQKPITAEKWPAIKWNTDETAAFHMVTNNVHVYNPADGFKAVVSKLPLPSIGAFSVSPGVDAKVAAYVAEKGGPASVCLYAVSSFPTDATGKPLALARRSFFRVSAAELLWNSTGKALLCVCSSEFDATNKNYYGEQQLHFLAADGSNDQRVHLSEGPIHDVQWSPRGDYFVVIAGFMPAKPILFNSQCKPIYDLGSGPYNFARWNPQGRFLCIAGFGNLPGDIIFFDKKSSGTCKRMGSVRCPSVSLEWAPDGRHVLTALTAPRLRVDNGFQVLTYYGEKLHHEQFTELFEARWVAAPQGTYPDRPQSPDRATAASEGSASASGARGGQEKSTSSYVAPHLRGRQSAEASKNFSLAHSEDEAGRIKGVFQRPKPTVPGGEFVSKSAARNAKRRAKKKSAKDVDKADETQETPMESEGAAHQEFPAAEVEPPSATADEGTSGEVDKAKRIRALQKKLRQIEQLKEKRDAGEGALQPTQLDKIATEQEVLKELRALGITE
ncbi:unnamed protein product [Ostreobium quekettii]|uniref:Eukaryotic translation initiation factor 2A n=1 Tax=Ostreobium quekettii TaxID=121088 RepID=A0A8S1J747_9CHLO|nr:unnamed protein product [Ostreobium quekettii]|eukprot:evm.model.scf_1141.1 EVM.evm.TU.scf_1141.1   scf_1141:2942-9504(+)